MSDTVHSYDAKGGRPKVLRGPMSGLECAAATRDLQTDVAFGRSRVISIFIL